VTKWVQITRANKGVDRQSHSQKKLLVNAPSVGVFLGSRDRARGEKALAKLIEECGEKACSRLAFVTIDTSDNESVTAAAKDVLEAYGKDVLYVIINSAGILGNGF